MMLSLCQPSFGDTGPGAVFLHSTLAGLEIDNEKVKNNSIFDTQKKVKNSYLR